MKSVRLVLLVGFVALFARVGFAQTIDPVIGVGGGSGSTTFGGQAMFVISPANGASCSPTLIGETTVNLCNFTSPVLQNGTGQNIVNFDFMFSQAQATSFSVLQGSIFPNLTVVSGVLTANPQAILSGGIIVPFVPPITLTSDPPGEFNLTMNGVIQGTTVDVVSNVPEPGTLTLLLAGVGAFALRRKSGPKVKS